MKAVYPPVQDRLDASLPSSNLIRPVQADEVLQEQMRRLHNARARQRAVRHPRAARAPM
ncbi:hypothetical protein [Methylobacterium mesophilicum]|uniref:hypothetical protein n=1 Tax=Methylobacterium mesophilicum TaxID=39956 RepID=UPI0003A7ED3B|nr:hypothetical protein [Methylobacterium mesophilicum]